MHLDQAISFLHLGSGYMKCAGVEKLSQKCDHLVCGCMLPRPNSVTNVFVHSPQMSWGCLGAIMGCLGAVLGPSWVV